MLGIKVEPIALKPYSRDSSKSLAKLSQRSANRSAHMQSPSDASAQNFRVVQCLRKGLGHTRPKTHQFYDESKTSALGSEAPPAPQSLSEFLERQSGAGAPRSRERGSSFLQDLVLLQRLQEGLHIF
jgi:hypothetical protein